MSRSLRCMLGFVPMVAALGLAGCEQAASGPPPAFPTPAAGASSAPAPSKEAPKSTDGRPVSSASQDSAITHQAPK
jgi:hypothetical protein